MEPIFRRISGTFGVCALLAACGEDAALVSIPEGDPETMDASVEDAAPPVQEPCNGFDDDGNRKVDEGCSCTVGATQECYPAQQMPATCRKGKQSCVVSDGRPTWGECVDALVPLAGRNECCTALGAMPEHNALKAFVAAYPISALPSSPSAVNTFAPVAGGFKLVNGNVVVGNEFVDVGRGGITVANVTAGRVSAREAALKNLGVNAADILHTEEPVPITMGSGCGGWGGALGSILYRTAERGVRELVYFYVGVCNGGDAEGFYHSELALEVCTAGSVPK